MGTVEDHKVSKRVRRPLLTNKANVFGVLSRSGLEIAYLWMAKSSVFVDRLAKATSICERVVTGRHDPLGSFTEVPVKYGQ